MTRSKLYQSLILVYLLLIKTLSKLTGRVYSKTYPPKEVANPDPLNKTKSAITAKENIELTPQIHIITNDVRKDRYPVVGWRLFDKDFADRVRNKSYLQERTN